MHPSEELDPGSECVENRGDLHPDETAMTSIQEDARSWNVVLPIWILIVEDAVLVGLVRIAGLPRPPSRCRFTMSCRARPNHPINNGAAGCRAMHLSQAFSSCQPWLTMINSPVSALVSNAAEQQRDFGDVLDHSELFVDGLAEHYFLHDALFAYSEFLSLLRDLLLDEWRRREDQGR